MKYAKVETPVREALVALEPTNWGASYQKLSDQTDVSGYELWLAESSNNFDNVVAKAMEALHKQRGAFALIVRDTAEEGGRGVDGKGRLDMIYSSHAGMPELEQSHRVLAPPRGWYVPTDDDIFVKGKIWVPFYQGTLVPRETVQNKKEAVKRLEAKGIAKEWVSYFWHPDGYKEKMFVGSGFFPSWDDGGRFRVFVSWRPSPSSHDWIASLPAYREQKLLWKSLF